MMRFWSLRLWIALGIALLVVLLTVDEPFHFNILQRLELSSLDYRFVYRGVNPVVRDSSNVIIVEINDESSRSIPQAFPWPRSIYAHLVRNLKLAGAKAVGIDLIFDTPDSHGSSGDSTFRRALQETQFVVLSGKREQDADRYEQFSKHNNFGNIFSETDSAVGLVNIRSDADGVYRLYNPYFVIKKSEDEELGVPTLAFGVLYRVMGCRPFYTALDGGDHFTYLDRTLPKYDAGSVLINYYGPNGTFKHIKFHDVLDDESFQTREEIETGQETNTFSDPDYGYLHDGTFQGKIVLVGVTSPEYKDLFPVSFGRGRQLGDNQMYGVELHANMIENVLRNDFLRVQRPVSEALEIVLLVVMVFLSTAAIRALPHQRQVFVELFSLGLVVFAVGAIVVLAFWLFVQANYVVHMVSPVAAVLSGYIGSTVYNLSSERKQRLLIKSMFSTYVNPSVVDELLEDPGKLALGGQRKELTVLFSDIEGFTTFAQTMDPEQLVELLNEYLDDMSERILAFDGTLDKYEGDAIMAFWGAPVPLPDHALLACKSALAMRDGLKELNKHWGEQGRPELRMRIGINTGDMVVGNMGSRGKFAYTVMGDSVNLASRLEGANKVYRTSIMVSRRTFELVKDQIVGRELDTITVKGRSEPVGVYELLFLRDGDIDVATVDFLEVYTRGMELYHSRNWKEAREVFAHALELRPDDYPSRIHLDRAVHFHAVPSDENSDIVVLTEK